MFKKTLITLIFLVILVILVINVNAKTMDNPPTNYGVYYDEWGAPENAFSQDDSYAVSTAPSSKGSREGYYEFNFDDFWDDELGSTGGGDGCPVIDGIVVSFDAYGGVAGINFNINLSWDLGSTWTTGKTSANLPTSDTDTYINVGGSSDTWGRTWSYEEFLNDNFAVFFMHNSVPGFGYMDHIIVYIYYSFEVPGETSLKSYNDGTYCYKALLKCSSVSGADSYLIKYGGGDYPTLSTGTVINNGSATVYWSYPYFGSNYFLGMWVWNSTYCCYSTRSEDYFQSPCNYAINLTINDINCSVTNETDYNKVNGWDITFNASNNGTNINEYLTNTSGTTTSYYNASQNKYIINSTYATFLILYENIENATGTHEGIYFEFVTGAYLVWANYTGNDTGGGCELRYLNYSDENITINITYWGCNTTNTSNYAVNETNWLDLLYGSISFDNDQFGIFLTLSLFIIFFDKGYRSKKRSGGAFMMFSGFTFFAFEYIASSYLHSIIIAFLGVFGIFIIILGIRKLLYPAGDEKTKTEGE